MKRNWFYILLALARGPSYGSAIQEDVRALSDGAVRLWPATLYGSLEDLLAEGWLAEAPDHEPEDGRGGRERFYTLTASGRQALEVEAMRLEGLAAAVRSRLADAGPA